MSRDLDIANPARTRAIMHTYGLQVKKSLGQNFLTDQNVLHNIVATADIGTNDNVIEIGPGIGALTEYLARAAHHVLAFEIDDRLLPILDETLADYDNVTVVNQDILKADLAAMISEHLDNERPLKLVANLPYYITTPILMNILAGDVAFENIVVMMQKEVADRLAARLSSEVLSCDAMQIYRGMDIGTAKMAPDECTVPLRLVDIVEPGVAYSAALYQADARAHVERLLGSGCLPVFCGGTGLYLKAALDEMDFPSGELEDDRRMGYQELAERIGEEELHALLAERDPESAAVIHPHNVRRVIRALEMHDDGISYAQQKSQFSVPREHYHALWFGLTRNREVLYERINLRVDLMFEQGLVDEVRGLMDQGLGDALTSMQAIGYKEIIDAFNGVISMDEARELIKMRSRRYAKRQLSWFKRDDRIVWFDMDEFTIDEVVEDILHRIEAA